MALEFKLNSNTSSKLSEQIPKFNLIFIKEAKAL